MYLGISTEQQCAYRAPNGDRCAVGALISNLFYSPNMEGRSIKLILERWPMLGRILGGTDNLSFLQALQEVHDSAPVDAWPERLRYVAIRFGLHSRMVDYYAPFFKPSPLPARRVAIIEPLTMHDVPKNSLIPISAIFQTIWANEGETNEEARARHAAEQAIKHAAKVRESTVGKERVTA